MLNYAEENLFGETQKDGGKFLRVYVNDSDTEFLSLVALRSFAREPEGDRPFARFVIYYTSATIVRLPGRLRCVR
jgi:hypothetical protein